MHFSGIWIISHSHHFSFESIHWRHAFSQFAMDGDPNENSAISHECLICVYAPVRAQVSCTFICVVVGPAVCTKWSSETSLGLTATVMIFPQLFRLQIWQPCALLKGLMIIEHVCLKHAIWAIWSIRLVYRLELVSFAIGVCACIYYVFIGHTYEIWTNAQTWKNIDMAVQCSCGIRHTYSHTLEHALIHTLNKCAIAI